MKRTIMAAFLAASWASACGGGDAESASSAGASAAAGASTPEPAPAILDAPLPPLDILDLEGRPADLGQFRGRAFVLNFWATWCIPCLDEMPELEEMHAAYPPDAFTVVGVSIDEGGVETIETFLAEQSITYPNFRGRGEELFERLGLYPGVPHTLLVDAEGVVRGHWSGRFHPFEAETEALVREVLSA